jgi:hypothetical protein
MRLSRHERTILVLSFFGVEVNSEDMCWSTKDSTGNKTPMA